MSKETDAVRAIIVKIARATGSIAERVRAVREQEMATRQEERTDPSPPVATSDVVVDVKPVPMPAARGSRDEIIARIEAALREHPYSPEILAADKLNVPLGILAPILRELRSKDLIWNINTNELPMYIWKIGKDATPPEIRAAIVKLIQRTPCQVETLFWATGVHRDKIQAQLQILKKRGYPIKNMGTPKTPNAYMLPATFVETDALRDGTEPQKTRKGRK